MTGNRISATCEQRRNHSLPVALVPVEFLPFTNVHIGTPVNSDQPTSRRCLSIGGIIDAEPYQLFDKHDSVCTGDSFHAVRLHRQSRSCSSVCTFWGKLRGRGPVKEWPQNTIWANSSRWGRRVGPIGTNWPIYQTAGCCAASADRAASLSGGSWGPRRPSGCRG